MKKTVLLNTGLMIALMSILGMGAVSCKSIGEDEFQQNDADLLGIYDENYLFQLVEVGISADKKSGTYRFESCNASGKTCVSAFQDAEGQEVLIDLVMVDELDRGRDEYYQEFAQQVDKYLDTQLAEHKEKMFVNLTISGVGAGVQGLSVLPTFYFPYLLIYHGLQHGRVAFGIAKAITSMIAGYTIYKSGRLVKREAVDRHFQAEEEYKDALGNKREVQDAYETVFVKHSQISDAILSIDPNNHLSLVGDESIDVKNMTLSFAKYFNTTFGRHTTPPGNVVDDVCFVEDDVKVCNALDSAQ